MNATRFVFFGFFLVILSSVFGTSCVGKKRFEREISARDSSLMHLNQRVMSLNQEIARLELQLAEKTGENNALTALQTRHENKIKQLEEEIEKLTNKSLNQQQLMDMALQRKAQEVAEKEEVINNLQRAIDQREQTLRDLLGKIQSALQQYDQAELSLEFKDGKAYVGLSEKLLFRSGSAALGKDAMNILEKISEVLSKHPELDIIVEGHTDNVPIKSRDFKDNWDLSVIRATTVARILTKEYGLNSSQVTAAGRGEFQPRASNETAEGRALNRRTEIILAPRLDEVMRLIEENASTSK